MRAQKLFEHLKRIAGIRLHQKHKIGTPKQIQAVHGDGHSNKQRCTPKGRLQIRGHLIGGDQKQRIQHQQNMDREAVQMEEIPDRHAGPVWKEQCKRSAGNRKIIQKASDHFCLLDDVKKNQQNIDAAKVEGKISPAEFIQNDQYKVFYHFLREDICAQYSQHKLPFARRKLVIENAGRNAEKQTCQKPENMGKAKGLKTHALRYVIAGYKKHSYHPRVLYHSLTKNASVKYKLGIFCVA